MKLKYFLLIILGLVFSVSQIKAQTIKNYSCGHDFAQSNYWKEHPEEKNDYLELLENSKTTEYINGKKRSKFIIPVVFHVIHNDGDENLYDQQIIEHLKFVNLNYQKLNSDTAFVDPAYRDIIANCNFEFRLATIDPNNNCTNGITHHKSVLTNNADDYTKFNQWNRKNYLNIWVIKNFEDVNLGGYAKFPTSVLSSNYYSDGVIILANALTFNATTLIHEIGHYFGLPHTFHDEKFPNKTGVTCGDDGIVDTPRTKGKTYDIKKEMNNGVNVSNFYRSSICDLDTTTYTNNFEGVTNNSGKIYNKLVSENITEFQISNLVNNFILDTTKITPSFPYGAKTSFSTKNLSANSSIKTKLAYSKWPLGGIDKDTVTSKYLNNIDTNKYYQLNYISSYGNSVDIKGLKIVFSRNREGIKSFSVRTSLDNFKKDVEISSVDKLLRVSNNIVNLKSDTTKSFVVNLNINNENLVDFRDGKNLQIRFYGWNAENTSGTFVLEDLFLLSESSKFQISDFKAVNLSENSIKSGKLAFTNWELGGKDKDTILGNQTGQINDTKYYEFKIQPYKRKLINIDSLYLSVSRNLNGVKSFSVRSNLDGFQNDLAFETSSKDISIKNNIGFFKVDTNQTYILKIKLNKNNKFQDLRSQTPVSFRIYGWNAESNTGTLEVDSLSVFTIASTIENVDNFMDYSDYTYMFTNNQASVMTSFLTNNKSVRYSLHQEDNLVKTGTTNLTKPVCEPKAYFYLDKKYACIGDEVKFYDRSWGSVIDERTWIFEDANIKSSNEINPIVKFNSVGYKKVILIAKNSIGQDSVIQENAVFISDNNSEIKDLFNENFENGIPNNWLVENNENNEVRFQSSIGRWGSKGVKLNIYKDVSETSMLNENDYFYYKRLRDNQDALVTPSVNFKTINDAKLTFDYAYSTSGYYDSLIVEKLNVKFSADCGKNWFLLETKSLNSDLITSGSYGNKEFIPSKDEMWKTALIKLENVPNVENIRFKIEFISSTSSNNLFIDNVNLNGVVSIEDNPLNEMHFNIVPNPTSNDRGVNIEYIGNEKPITFELIDLQGKILTKEINTNTNGTISHSLKLTNHLQAGYYTLKISQGEYVSIKKLIIQ